MKLFGNDSKRTNRRPVSRNTADFKPVSEAKADKARAAARRQADRARESAYREYAGGAAAPKKQSHEAVKAAAKQPRAAKRPGGSGGKKAVIAVCCVLAVLVLGAAGFCFYVAGCDTIYPNVTLGGVELGGLGVTEAAYELETSGWSNEGETVTVELPMEHTLSVSAAEAGASVTAEQAAQTAWDYCREGGLFARVGRYISCMISGGSAEVEIKVDEAAVRAIVDENVADILNDLDASGVELDEDDEVIRVVKGATDLSIDAGELTSLICGALAERRYGALEFDVDEENAAVLDVDTLYEELCREPVSAGWDAETEEVTPSVTGVEFSKSEARSLWDAAALGDTVEIPCEITEPEYTTEQYEELLFADAFGDPVTTSLSGSTANRITNVELAANSINGVILSPGEQFDYNECLGQRTAERGYKAAGAYSGGQVVQEVGGGICQVSSALYYAALLANLQIDVRSCHYFPVNYLPAGLDATVSWGGPEFKFTNDRDWPVKITASVDRAANTVTVQIYGTNLDGSYVVMEHAVTGYVYGNSEYPDVATGYKASTNRCVYSADGELISREFEAGSTYHYHEENIVYPSPSPSPSEEPQPTEPVSEPSGEPIPDTPAGTEPPAATEAPQAPSDPGSRLP